MTCTMPPRNAVTGKPMVGSLGDELSGASAVDHRSHFPAGSASSRASSVDPSLKSLGECSTQSRTVTYGR
jgi:hypothetical protein